jgi:hypothetical protein
LRALPGFFVLAHPRLDACPLPPRAAARPWRRTAEEHLEREEDDLFAWRLCVFAWRPCALDIDALGGRPA